MNKNAEQKQTNEREKTKRKKDLLAKSQTRVWPGQCPL